MQPSLYVIIPGFGPPHPDTKMTILQQNLAILARFPWSRIDVHVCCYDSTVEPPPAGTAPEPVVLHWHRGPGIVTDFLRTLATPAAVAPYDYVLILLDDILLDQNSVNLAEMVRIQRTFQLDLVSPTIARNSPELSPYPYMMSDPEHSYDLKITTCCEMFCYLMPKHAYLVYYTHLDPKNPWNWGLDLMLTVRLHFRVGMLNHMNMLHFFARKDGPPVYPHLADPWEGYRHTLQKYGFPEGNQRLAELPSTLCIIRELATLPSDI